MIFVCSTLFSAAFAQDTTSFKTYFDDGLAKYKSKDYTNAIANFDKAIDKKSDVATNMAVAYYYRALSKRYGTKDLQGALKDFNSAIENKSDNADFFFERHQ